MPGRDYLYTVNINICYSIDGGYRSYHVLQDQLHNYISYSEHKRHQLSDRLRIEIELKEINVKNLRFDHLICSDVLDIKLELFTDIPGSVCDIFKEPFKNIS
ncbi:7896_t:CDS:2 [Funneliformis geosporum]|uniref:7896_t:CDS:1 n=1 Tax=Funneliformis geosporum TaxID=1117311 RepID=A0A9W4SPA3_9GLOM|nr:7896_t:CDS:2 [Funneliformis geosporum]